MSWENLLWLVTDHDLKMASPLISPTNISAPLIQLHANMRDSLFNCGANTSFDACVSVLGNVITLLPGVYPLIIALR